MNKIDRINEIHNLKMKQFKLIEKSIKIAMLPKPKRASTSIKRSFRIMSLMLECRVIQQQIKVIMSKPIVNTKYESGCVFTKNLHHEKMD